MRRPDVRGLLAAALRRGLCPRRQTKPCWTNPWASPPKSCSCRCPLSTARLVGGLLLRRLPLSNVIDMCRVSAQRRLTQVYWVILFPSSAGHGVRVASSPDARKSAGRGSRQSTGRSLEEDRRQGSRWTPICSRPSIAAARTTRLEFGTPRDQPLPPLVRARPQTSLTDREDVVHDG